MSEDRSVSLGCFTTAILVALLLTLGGISYKLGKIAYEIRFLACVEAAKAGVSCVKAGKK